MQSGPRSVQKTRTILVQPPLLTEEVIHVCVSRTERRPRRPLAEAFHPSRLGRVAAGRRTVGQPGYRPRRHHQHCGRGDPAARLGRAQWPTSRGQDKAITAGNARMLLRMSDRSTIKLGENSGLLTETQAVRQPQAASPSELSATLRLVTGVFRHATDYSSKALGHKRDFNLKMATATVGIRGTDFWSMTDAAHDAVCRPTHCRRACRPRATRPMSWPKMAGSRCASTSSPPARMLRRC